MYLHTLIFRTQFIHRTYRKGWKKGLKLLNVQDGIRPYRMEKQLKINNLYMYDYLIAKSSVSGLFLPVQEGEKIGQRTQF